MENKQFYFYNQCPKCDKTNELEITKWHDASWTFHDGKEYITEPIGVIYFSLFCTGCNQCIAGKFPYGLENGTPRRLSEYDQGDGNVSRFVNKFHNKLIYDSTPLEYQNLFKEARVCYSANAFTAVMLLCRTILDLESQKIWDRKFENKKQVKLKNRLEELFPTTNDRSDETKHYHISNLIRLDGNMATHEITSIDKNDAKKTLDSTEYFINQISLRNDFTLK